MCIRPRAPRPAARRRGLFAAIVIAAVTAASGATAASAQRPAPLARAHSASRDVRKSVDAAGTYEVVVSVRARGKHERIVRVYLTGERMRKAVALPWWGSHLRYRLHLSTPALIVRAVSAPPAVAVRVTMTLEQTPPAPSAGAVKPKQSVSTSPPRGTTTPSPSVSTPTASPPASTAPPAPPASPPAPPAVPSPAPDPYTNLAWEDNFVADFVAGGSVPNQLPNTANWSLDSWSGCGPQTLSTPTPNGSPGADRNVYLTANGLAITALQTGPYSYSSAQLDSIGPQADPQSFPAGGTIEASIALPSGQGLCPAFWMLADNPVAGASTPGEIDVLEAPSFGPLPTTRLLRPARPHRGAGVRDLRHTGRLESDAVSHLRRDLDADLDHLDDRRRGLRDRYGGQRSGRLVGQLRDRRVPPDLRPLGRRLAVPGRDLHAAGVGHDVRAVGEGLQLIAAAAPGALRRPRPASLDARPRPQAWDGKLSSRARRSAWQGSSAPRLSLESWSTMMLAPA